MTEGCRHRSLAPVEADTALIAAPRGDVDINPQASMDIYLHRTSR